MSSRCSRRGRNGNVFDEFWRFRMISEKFFWKNKKHLLVKIRSKPSTSFSWFLISLHTTSLLMNSDITMPKLYISLSLVARRSPERSISGDVHRSSKFVVFSLLFQLLFIFKLCLFVGWCNRKRSMPKSDSFSSQRSLIRHVSDEIAPCTPRNDECKANNP